MARFRDIKSLQKFAAALTRRATNKPRTNATVGHLHLTSWRYGHASGGLEPIFAVRAACPGSSPGIQRRAGILHRRSRIELSVTAKNNEAFTGPQTPPEQWPI